jgi:hypothetical protein
MTEEKTMFDRMAMGLEIYIAWLNMWNTYIQHLTLFATTAKEFLNQTEKIHKDFGFTKGMLYG